MSEKDEIQPSWDSANVPYCQHECASYDGKRCKLMGFRPDIICEPAVISFMKRTDIEGKQ